MLLTATCRKVSGLEEHCSRCLRQRGGRGSVVLMVMDVAFTSIGLNYFTAVVPKVEEFNRKFVKNGKIKKLKELAEADINELRKCGEIKGHGLLRKM